MGSVSSGLTSGYCGTKWFSDFNGYGCGSTNADYAWCLTDWYGGAYQSGNNIWASYYNVCPEIGNATLTISGTAGAGSWFVPLNTCRAFWRTHWGYSCGFLGTSWCHNRFNERGDVTNALTTTFNYQGYFIWR